MMETMEELKKRIEEGTEGGKAVTVSGRVLYAIEDMNFFAWLGMNFDVERIEDKDEVVFVRREEDDNN